MTLYKDRLNIIEAYNKINSDGVGVSDYDKIIGSLDDIKSVIRNKLMRKGVGEESIDELLHSVGEAFFNFQMNRYN